jgi:hypothetical protein
MEDEIEITLPQGYRDSSGAIHQQGMMRRATALDEVAASNDPRAHANESYLSILLLSRVVTRLGNADQVTPEVIERLYAADFAYLQELYVLLNDAGAHAVETVCPACQARFALDLLSTDHEPSEPIAG